MEAMYIKLENLEMRALHDLADREGRDRHNQARWIIRCELERIGLLTPEVTTEKRTPSNAAELGRTDANDRADVHSPRTVGAVNGSLQHLD